VSPSSGCNRLVCILSDLPFLREAPQYSHILRDQVSLVVAAECNGLGFIVSTVLRTQKGIKKEGEEMERCNL